MTKVSFSWSNYFRATPKNLEYLAAALRRIVAVVAGVTVIMEADKWVPFAVLLAGAILDELKNFFAHAAEGEQETVSVTFPASMADDVEVKQETKPENT